MTNKELEVIVCDAIDARKEQGLSLIHIYLWTENDKGNGERQDVDNVPDARQCDTSTFRLFSGNN